jgi:FkbH-like protein
MKYFIFRNYTVEPFFKDVEALFSGYEDISHIDETVDAFVWFYLMPLGVSERLVSEEILKYRNLLSLALGKINTAGNIYIFTLSPVYYLRYQTANAEIEDAVYDYNSEIGRLAKENVNIKIININDFFIKFADKDIIDWKFYFLSQIPVNPKLAPDFSLWFKRQIEITGLKRKKCVILDLDNTLWGGILGEDGIEGIKTGEDYPGNCYLFFQKYLLELSRNGLLLAICSKNNEADVLNILDKLPEMALRREHFVSFRINWNNKAENIIEIASELNIGLDSMVFIDDNPSERELVKQMLPEVSVPDFPVQPYLLPVFIKNINDNFFSVYKITDEDINKTQLYKENFNRLQSRNQFTDFDGYLKSLELELTIEPLNKLNIVRLAQLTQKTNQFNLTTQRYTESDLLLFSEKGFLIYGLRVKDRFGDNGLTGLIIISIENETAGIDTFLLSCRVLGKRIEEVFINYILEKLKKCGIRKLKARYVKTLKNQQVDDFYDKTGFEILSDDNETKMYELDLKEFGKRSYDFCKVVH